MRADSYTSSSKSEQESLLPELLHALSQPLTSLRCSLELTLLQPRDSEEYRKRLQESLGLTQEITMLTGGIKELLEAEKPGNSRQRLSFDAILRTTVQELLPVASSGGVGLSLLPMPALAVLGDPDQFYKALLYLLDFALVSCCTGDELLVQSAPHEGCIECTIECARHPEQDSTPETKPKGTARSYLNLLIARRVLEVAGGTVFLERTPQQFYLRLQLPMAAEVAERGPTDSVFHTADGEPLERAG